MGLCKIIFRFQLDSYLTIYKPIKYKNKDLNNIKNKDLFFSQIIIF